MARTLQDITCEMARLGEVARNEELQRREAELREIQERHLRAKLFVDVVLPTYLERAVVTAYRSTAQFPIEVLAAELMPFVLYYVSGDCTLSDGVTLHRNDSEMGLLPSEPVREGVLQASYTLTITRPKMW